MSLVRSKNTRPEMVVRQTAHTLGYRYRLHVHGLSGTPDLVFPRFKRVIFIHGCFWHQHRCASGNRMPKSRIDFWRTKLEGNVVRDRRVLSKLRRDGWRVLVVWECQTSNPDKLTKRISRFLDA
jgi:DNA mismatch endonuclease, patch repair protein